MSDKKRTHELACNEGYTCFQCDHEAACRMWTSGEHVFTIGRGYCRNFMCSTKKELQILPLIMLASILQPNGGELWDELASKSTANSNELQRR